MEEKESFFYDCYNEVNIYYFEKNFCELVLLHSW